jgi:hypothetical protein
MRVVCGDRAGDFEVEMKTLRTLEKICFAPCATGISLLDIMAVMARGARVGGMFSIFSAGNNFIGGFTPEPPAKINLTRREIFRGKISLRQNQTNRNHLEERTPRAPN